MTQDFKKFTFYGYFRIIGYFEILSHYLEIDNSYWLKEVVLWITDKVFREKLLV